MEHSCAKDRQGYTESEFHGCLGQTNAARMRPVAGSE